MSGKERLNAVDIAKGIGILLVVIGHVPPSEHAIRFIYNFHMPLFFFLSGLFLDEKKYNLRDFILTRVKTLLIPIITFCIIAIMLQLIPSFDYRHPSWGIGGAALWFLPVLFCSECLIYCLWRLFNNRVFRTVLTCLFFVGGIICSRLSLHLPFALHALPFATAMFASGALLKNFVSSYLKTDLKIRYADIVLFFACFITIALLAYFLTDYTNMYNGHIAFGMFGIAVAFAGIIWVIVLSKLIDKSGLILINRAFIYMGRNSLVIFGTHLAFKGVFVRLWGSISASNIGLYFAALLFVLGGGTFNGRIDKPLCSLVYR